MRERRDSEIFRSSRPTVFCCDDEASWRKGFSGGLLVVGGTRNYGESFGLKIDRRHNAAFLIDTGFILVPFVYYFFSKKGLEI